MPCVVGIADHAGWAHVVCTAMRGRVPAVIERRRITLIDAGLPTLPYHHDTLTMREAEADALIARVRRSIADRTSEALTRLVSEVAPHTAVVLAIRELRFADLPRTVAAVRQSYQLQCAADGMMYHLALCHAARQLGLEVHQCRRGGETALAASRTGVTVEQMEAFVGDTGRPAGAPWTQEHRRAYAAGIAALAVHMPGRIRIRQTAND